MRTPSEIRREKLANYFEKVVDEGSFSHTVRNMLDETAILTIKAADEGFTVEFPEIYNGYYYLKEFCKTLDEIEKATGGACENL